MSLGTLLRRGIAKAWAEPGSGSGKEWISAGNGDWERAAYWPSQNEGCKGSAYVKNLREVRDVSQEQAPSKARMDQR